MSGPRLVVLASKDDRFVFWIQHGVTLIFQIRYLDVPLEVRINGE